MKRQFGLSDLLYGVTVFCVATALLRGAIYEPEPVSGFYVVRLATGLVTLMGYQFPPSGDPLSSLPHLLAGQRFSAAAW